MTRGIKNSNILHLLKREFLNELDYRQAYEQEADDWQLPETGELYQILKDGRVVANFSEGQPDRHGRPMHYTEFMEEYASFVRVWSEKMDASRLGYRVTAGMREIHEKPSIYARY
jgi:hypothetical protein